MSTAAAASEGLRRPPPRLPKTNDACWCGSGKKYKKCHQDDDLLFLRHEKQWLKDNEIKKGIVSPRRPVPMAIKAPDYAQSGQPSRGSGRHVRTDDEIARMRKACRAAAHVLRLTGAMVKPGISTDALDAFAHEQIVELGGYPSPLNYRGFPKSICTSVNEVICHGIPDSRLLKDGDIVNLDITIFLDGVHGDTNATFFVGQVDDESQRLVKVTHEAMMQGIGAVKVGRPIFDIGRAIEAHADAAGFSVVRSYCGHGIGDTFHTNLQIPHYYDPKASQKMESGMTFTIEPMINAGVHDEEHWDDDWTVVTKDRRRSAQFEHTILVTDSGAEILTRE
jgi:methionyl aminopeptidase